MDLAYTLHSTPLALLLEIMITLAKSSSSINHIIVVVITSEVDHLSHPLFATSLANSPVSGFR